MSSVVSCPARRLVRADVPGNACGVFFSMTTADRLGNRDGSSLNVPAPITYAEAPFHASVYTHDQGGSQADVITVHREYPVPDLIGQTGGRRADVCVGNTVPGRVTQRRGRAVVVGEASAPTGLPLLGGVTAPRVGRSACEEPSHHSKTPPRADRRGEPG